MKKNHGGRRRGSGRPPKYDGGTIVIGASIPLALAATLDRVAADSGMNRSEAITQALTEWLRVRRGRKKLKG